MKFDDINLEDDKAAPKLDLDFGLNPAADKKSSGGFSFGGGLGGGWGGVWGGTSSWGFGGADESKAPPAEDTGWNFSGSGGAKKDKKKKDGGFDFNFDTGAGEADNLDLGSPAQETPVVEDSW